MKRILDLFTRRQEIVSVPFGQPQSNTEPWLPPNPDAAADLDDELELPVADEAVSEFSEADDPGVTDDETGELQASDEPTLGDEQDNQSLPPEEEAAYRQGWQDAAEAAEVELADIRTALARSITNLDAAGEELADRYRAEAVELAAQLAKAVVGSHLSVTPETIKAVVEQAIKAVPESCEVTIRCHTDDLETIEAHLPTIQGQRNAPIHVRASEDNAVERGGCVIRFDEGAVDAQPSVSVDALREALEAHLAGRTGPAKN